MSAFYNYVIKISKRLINNIAFVPTLMGSWSLFLAIVILYLEYNNYTDWFNNNLAFALVQGPDNARMVLTTIIGGVISLTVFSFSMVMVVLNRASASLSPRVLPQLIAQTSHQVVLGFYMGTIIYSLILVVNVDPGKHIPSFGILLAMIFTIGSLGIFIFFIHSISRSIQVDNILKDILKQTMHQVNLAIQMKCHEEKSLHEVQKIFPIKAELNGYFQLENMKDLTGLLKEHSITIYTHVWPGQFVTKGAQLAVINGNKPDSNVINLLRSYFTVVNYIEDDDDYHFGLKKISEIAVKALSPGINDPGTAVRAIRYLTILFVEIIELEDNICYTDDKDFIRFHKKLIPLDILLTQIITPIRQYSAGSAEILIALFEFYHILLKDSKAKSNTTDTLLKHLKALAVTASDDVNNSYDKVMINEYIERITKLEICPTGHLLPLQ